MGKDTGGDMGKHRGQHAGEHDSARAGARSGEHDSTQGGGHSTARFRIAVVAVIERDGRYLLAHRSDIPWWNLPGGGLEYGETLEEGLAREIREEIGAAIEIVRLVGVYSKPQKREVVFTFLCHLAPSSPPPAPSEEVSRVAWFLPNELPTNVLPKHRERLHDALRGQAEAILHAQTTSTAQDQGLSPTGGHRRDQQRNQQPDQQPGQLPDDAFGGDDVARGTSER